MNLKRSLEVVYVVFIFLILVLGVLSFLALKNHTEEVNFERKRYESLNIARELAQSSDDLTRYCRTYVSTGDSTWENRYWGVLDIRNGVKPRPDGRQVALQDSIKKLGITPEEFELLEKAERNSNELVWTEKVAFNAMKGFFADEDSNFTIKGEPDPTMARRIMFDEKYHYDKYHIMNPIHQFEEMLEGRMSGELRSFNKVSNLLILSIILVILLIIVTTTIAFIFLIKEKLIKEKEKLEKAYKKLEESEHRYKVLFNASPDAYVIVTDGVIVDFNKSAQKMVNCDGSYLFGKTPADISPEFQPEGKRSDEAAMEKTEEAIKTGLSTFEWIVKCYDNIQKYVEVSIVPIFIDDKMSLFATWRDITDRKLMEQELRRSENSLKMAQAIGKMGSWEIELDTWRFIGSEQAGKIYGITSQKHNHEMPFAAALEAPLPEYKEIINESFKRLFEKGEDYNIEFRLRRFDNREIVWANSKAELNYDDQGKPNKITGIIQDITERKNNEEALRKSEANLREINATKDKFFSIVSHDLKGPFSALLSLSDILLEEYKELSEEEKITYIQSIKEISSNSYKLLENLLEWSRIQTGVLKYNPEKVNLLTAIYPSLKILEKAAQNKKINFDYNIDGAYELFADRNMLDTIIRNLVNNAIKFTDRGGNVKLSVRGEGKCHEISVTDNGRGIKKRILAKLFRIEDTVSTRGTANEEGTGLGLLLCKEMVDMHGGKIWVDSEEGKGTTFTFKIPEV